MNREQERRHIEVKMVPENEALAMLATFSSHLIALGRDDLAPFPGMIVCPRCDGQTYDRGSCGLCRNLGWLDKNGEPLVWPGALPGTGIRTTE